MQGDRVGRGENKENGVVSNGEMELVAKRNRQNVNIKKNVCKATSR